MADDLDKNSNDFDQSSNLGSDSDLGEFDDFNSSDGGFANTVNNSLGLKIGIVAAAVVFIIGGFMLFSGEEEDPVRSQMRSRANDVNEPPATEELSENMRNAIEDFNKEGLETAATSNESFIPVPVGPPTSTGIDIPEDDNVQADPLERWRVLQEQRAEQQRQQLESAGGANNGEPSAEESRRQEAVNKLAEAMVNGMQELTKKNTKLKFETQNITDEEYLDELQSEQEALLQETSASANNNMGNGTEIPPNVIVPEGEIEYAQMLIQANSDIPGPVLAQIVTGPLAGSRVIGEFSTEDEYLVITFRTVVIDSQSIPINAVAVDPDTNLTGVATEVDHRYFKRAFLPAAAAFVEGLTNAIAESGTTTVTISGDTVTSTQDTSDLDSDQEVATGISEAGKEIGEFMDEEADRTKILVRVAAGTPIGVLFLEPLVEGGASAQPTVQASAARNQQDQFEQFQAFQQQLQRSSLRNSVQ